MGYLFLLLTILAETAAIICLKLSDGFNNKAWAATGLFAFAATYVFLTLGLKRLDASLFNAVWAGSSTIIVAIAGIYFFKEQVSIVQFLFLGLIVIGIAGFNYFQKA